MSSTKWIILRNPENNNLLAQELPVIEEHWNGYDVEFNGETRFISRQDTYHTEGDALRAIRKFSKKLEAHHG